MGLLLLKLVMTPVFIGGASLGARRWGPAFGGWIISLPLTSGPVALFLALDRGAVFAAATAEASLAGCIGIAAYGVVYARSAGRNAWPFALAAGLAGWLLAAIAIQPLLQWPVPALFVLVALVIGLAALLMPGGVSENAAVVWSRWDVPLRMTVATSVVIAVTAAAPVLGAGTSGLLAMLPIMTTILAVFTHRTGGISHAISVQRGVLSGLLALLPSSPSSPARSFTSGSPTPSGSRSSASSRSRRWSSSCCGVGRPQARTGWRPRPMREFSWPAVAG